MTDADTTNLQHSAGKTGAILSDAVLENVCGGTNSDEKSAYHSILVGTGYSEQEAARLTNEKFG